MSSDAILPARRVLRAITAAVFAALLVAPAVDVLARSADARGPAPEGRSPAPFPATPRTLDEVLDWPRAAEARFRDVCGLRDVLLAWRSELCLRLLRVSPTDRAYLGRSGWMFYAPRRSADLFRGVVGGTPAEARAVADAILARREAARGIGAEYLLVLVPDKETIYADLVPAHVERLGPTRRELLGAELLRRGFDAYLDLTPALSAARTPDLGDGALYAPHGTHWQHAGSLAAYRAILERVAAQHPAVRALRDDELELVDAPRHYDSWARRMYVEDLLPCAPREPLPRTPRSVLVADRARLGPGSVRSTSVADARLPRAVLVHDSFGPYLERLLAEHFASLACVWGDRPDAATLRRFDPDLIVDLVVERNVGRVARGRGLAEDE